MTRRIAWRLASVRQGLSLRSGGDSISTVGAEGGDVGGGARPEGVGVAIEAGAVGDLIADLGDALVSGVEGVLEGGGAGVGGVLVQHALGVAEGDDGGAVA
jgi:hypothetical protein